MTILAIDLGTQSIRAAIVNINGSIEHLAQIPQAVDTPYPGWAQQKPKDWWLLTKRVITEVLLKYGKKDLIEAICTCGQMHGPVGLNKEGIITTEWAQIWMDKRGEKICAEFRERNDEQSIASEITGNPITTGWSGVKVRWIKENEPQVYQKSKWFLVPKDFINFMLTGVAATDPSEASGTYLYNFNTDTYSDEMANILNLDLNKFAPIHNSYETIGLLKPKISHELGLNADVPVIAGGGDFIVSLLGLGLIDDDIAVDMTGTSTLFVVHKDQPIIHPLVQNLKHVINGWTPFTMLDCGGLSMQWSKDFLKPLKEDITYEEMIDLAKNIPVGSDGLLFYPYMLGERRKENIYAQGCFFGVNLNHTVIHIARAVMEGIALALGKDVQNFKKVGVGVEKVMCVGGATRNRLLYQIKADVMQMPQIITNQPESSLKGCGLLAAYGLKLIDNFDNFMNSEDCYIIYPDPTNSLKYKKIQTNFNKMYNNLIGYWS